MNIEIAQYRDEDLHDFRKFRTQKHTITAK